MRFVSITHDGLAGLWTMNERWHIDNSNLTISTFAWEDFEMLSEMKNAGVYWIF